MTGRERAVVDALVPPGGALPGALESGFEGFEARFRAEAPLTMSLGWRASLFLAAWLSPVLAGRLPPLDSLPEEDRAEVLASLGRSRIYLVRQCFLLLKMVVGLGWASTPGVRGPLRYDAR